MKFAVALFAAVAMIPFMAHAQYYGHEYEGTQAPIRPGEKPVIPLDSDDPSYNAWRTPREDLNEGREPGPINVQRYASGLSWQGIPTFFHLPVALTPEDLAAGKVEVAIMGAFIDMSTGMRGAAYGPNAWTLLKKVEASCDKF